MKPFLFSLLIILGVIVIVGLGSVLLVLWAYGAGQVVLRILPSNTFNAFEATLLNLVGVLIVGLMMVRIVSSATSNPLSAKSLFEDEEDDEDEDGEDDLGEDDLPGIPLWRRPTKTLDFSGVKPNDPCPCGSGRKYKNCHGFKRSEEK
jgi:hypothetical protein